MQRLLSRIGYRWVAVVLATGLLTVIAVWYGLTPAVPPLGALVLGIVIAAGLMLSILSTLLLGVIAGPLHESIRATVTSNATAGRSLAHLLGSSDLPALGGWSMEPDAAVALVRTVIRHRPRTVLELGPGASSEVLLRALPRGTPIRALEHDVEWLEVVRQRLVDRIGPGVELRHAPLRDVAIDDWRGPWYDPSALEGLQDIELLVVDGPPGPHRTLARYPALPLLEPMLSDRALIFLDDAARPDEAKIVQRWLQRPSVDVLDRGPNWVLLVRDTTMTP